MRKNNKCQNWCVFQSGIALILLAVAFPISVFALPQQVILIRHAEKPEEGNTLNARGYARAAALPRFFQSNPTVIQHGPVTAIYAMAPKSEDGSIRAIETVTPTAQALGLEIHQDYTRDEVKDLVSEITKSDKFDGKTVLICWEHKRLMDIAAEFGVKHVPDWSGEVYDRAWIIEFPSEGHPVLTEIGEHVLPGDSI